MRKRNNLSAREIAINGGLSFAREQLIHVQLEKKFQETNPGLNHNLVAAPSLETLAEQEEYLLAKLNFFKAEKSAIKEKKITKLMKSAEKYPDTVSMDELVEIEKAE